MVEAYICSDMVVFNHFPIVFLKVPIVRHRGRLSLPLPNKDRLGTVGITCDLSHKVMCSTPQPVRVIFHQDSLESHS